ncbi:MAG: HNH endonuclease [PVC group bacterium]|nr:HNH endonuclease [PVC group bacterium]
MRKHISKKIREKIIAKTNGRCAYCGAEPDKLQIDHIHPLHLNGADDVSNYIAACRGCNHWKGSMTIEIFRKQIENIKTVLVRDQTAFSRALRYGLVEFTDKPVVFYFEKIGVEL